MLELMMESGFEAPEEIALARKLDAETGADPELVERSARGAESLDFAE